MHRFICLTFIFGNCWPDDLRTFGSRLKIATLKSEEVTGWKWMCFVIVEKQVVPLSCWQEDKNTQLGFCKMLSRLEKCGPSLLKMSMKMETIHVQ